jgi:hypothetical protein
VPSSLALSEQTHPPLQLDQCNARCRIKLFFQVLGALRSHHFASGTNVSLQQMSTMRVPPRLPITAWA